MMMHVNSTLSAEQYNAWKILLRDLSDLGGMIYSFPELGVTIAFMPEFPGSRMMLVSVSIAEARETKFRPKVGEYHALRRMFVENEYLKVPSRFWEYCDEDTINNWVLDFARSIA